MKKKAILSWSGGKDSAIALHEIRKAEEYEIAALLTTVTEDYDRISMHGIPRVLLEEQADSLGIRLEKVLISKGASCEEYAYKMKRILEKFLKLGVSTVVFGDIFLEDTRRYREGNLSKVGMKAAFPVWKKDTTWLAREFIDEGFKAVITCVDGKVLDKKFAGRVFDEGFLSELPSDVDPCGENGEFHSFVYEGPIFRKGIPHMTGDVVLRDNRFYFCDLIEVRDRVIDKNVKEVTYAV